MRNFDVEPLTIEEVKVYLRLLRDTMDAAQLLAAKIRAAEIIAGMEATGMAIDEHFTNPNPPDLPLHEGGVSK